MALLDDGDLSHLGVAAISSALKGPPESDGGVPGSGGAGGFGPIGSGGRCVIGGAGGFAGRGGPMVPPPPGPTPGAAGGSSAGEGAGGAAGGDDMPGGTGGAGGRTPSPGSGGSAVGGSGFGGTMGAGGRGGAPGCFVPHAIGEWRFDDCNTTRTDLIDARGGHTAYRSVSTACGEGISGQSVSFDGKEDLVYIPDQPDFTFADGVTIAAWANPSALGGARTIARKREQGTSSFVLLTNGRKYQFVVQIGRRSAISVSAPAKKDVWTHVAGTYDGRIARLYFDGQEVATAAAEGRIVDGAGPLLLGNDGDNRRFEGRLDGVFFTTQALAARDVLALTCRRGPLTVAVEPAMSAASAPGTAVSFDVAITNNDSPACAASDFVFSPSPPLGFTVSPPFTFVSIAAGDTHHLPVEVTSPDDADSGTFAVPFLVFGLGSGQSAQGALNVVVEATGCRVSSARELMIRAVSVVDDPIRTNPGDRSVDPRAGAWTFGHLMREVAATPDEAPDMVEEMLRTWLTNQTVNGFVIRARPAMDPLVLSAFPRTANGKLDLDRAPMTLLAIVNRFDLRNAAKGHAGEGRFIFGVTPFGSPIEFTIILEYTLPASNLDEVQAWADRWHALGALPFPSEEYNAALQAITDRFTRRGALPGDPNSSALNQFRTNEIALSFEWELREFVRSPAGRLVPATVKLTPDLGFNGSARLASYINTNEVDIVAERHSVPDTLDGEPFLAGAVLNPLVTWFAPGVTNSEARHKFALNTCNGCHSGETNTFFLQVSPRFRGQESSLSPFLTGTDVFDPISGETRTLNDIRRRNVDLKLAVCATQDAPSASGDAAGRARVTTTGNTPSAVSSAERSAHLAKGIDRVH